MSSSNGTPSKIIPISTPSQIAFKEIIGQSPSMKKIFRIVEKVAVSNTTIMLNGETGTGKGVIARAIHECSPRRSKPFIQINCGATPEGLLESEFFGYRRGAFTGAFSDKQGKFEMANGGTIFLDEIGDMSADLQVKVLRVLEEGEFERIGGHETIKADARFIAATHRDLEEEVQKGRFREDLFYRLHVIPILLPSLRERKVDIPVLIDPLSRGVRAQEPQAGDAGGAGSPANDGEPPLARKRARAQEPGRTHRRFEGRGNPCAGRPAAENADGGRRGRPQPGGSSRFRHLLPDGGVRV